MLRIIFMGTPEFAVPCLDMLVSKKEKYNVICVVTKPDMPKGRKNQMTPPPVKEKADMYGIPILQPFSVKTEEFAEQLKTYKPDLFVTVAYGKILPETLLNIPTKGCINVHASLLPKYRGAAPLWHAVINGEKESGITTMMTDIGMDTGDILMMDRVSIDEDMTMGELHDMLSELGAVTLEKTLDALEEGTITRVKQDNEKATYAPMVDRETGKINWNDSAKKIHNLVRGTNPFPVSYAVQQNGEKVKIWKTEIVYDKIDASVRPGDIIKESNEGIFVATGDGIIKIIEIQGQSARKMTAGEYINGHKIAKFT